MSRADPLLSCSLATRQIRMDTLEKRIKDFVKAQGVAVVGIAGPERLDGPPSLDPTYTMKGARSIVSLALPMDVGPIYDFLSKKNIVPHGLDQTRMNQKLFRITTRTAEFIRKEGFRSEAVPSNNTYRRSPDMFATHPSFSHRFGAIVSGIGGQGWSGNVMTREYGAAVYLGTVVTEAVLASDPPLSPRHFIDGYCRTCKICEKTCASGMFEDQAEEDVLLNGELHPRGRRRSIDFCNATCFGLHSLSRDKKWTSWGDHWIPGWVDHLPDGSRKIKIRYDLLKAGSLTGDSTPRYDLIRRIGSELHPEELIDGYVTSGAEKQPEQVRFRDYLLPFARKIGVTNAEDLRDERILTCGQCALVCGPTLEETRRRYQALLDGGLVVPGPGGEMTRAATFAEAVELRRKYPLKTPRLKMLRDGLASTAMWARYYLGIEPRSLWQGFLYSCKLRKARSEKKAPA